MTKIAIYKKMIELFGYEYLKIHYTTEQLRTMQVGFSLGYTHGYYNARAEMILK